MCVLHVARSAHLWPSTHWQVLAFQGLCSILLHSGVHCVQYTLYVYTTSAPCHEALQLIEQMCVVLCVCHCHFVQLNCTCMWCSVLVCNSVRFPRHPRGVHCCWVLPRLSREEWSSSRGSGGGCSCSVFGAHSCMHICQHTFGADTQ